MADASRPGAFKNREDARLRCVRRSSLHALKNGCGHANDPNTWVFFSLNKVLRFSGLFALLLWRGIYLSKLPGLEPKVRVFERIAYNTDPLPELASIIKHQLSQLLADYKAGRFNSKEYVRRFKELNGHLKRPN
jgi:hypothetical protein